MYAVLRASVLTEYTVWSPRSLLIFLCVCVCGWRMRVGRDWSTPGTTPGMFRGSYPVLGITLGWATQKASALVAVLSLQPNILLFVSLWATASTQGFS